MVDRRLAQARRLRTRQTFAEARFWRLIRDRGFAMIKFRRQVPLGPYVADFVCFEHRLVVELDGGVHDAPFRDAERDRQREQWLEIPGFTVLRFRNADVELWPNVVLDRIREAVGLPSPLAGEGGRGAVG